MEVKSNEKLKVYLSGIKNLQKTNLIKNKFHKKSAFSTIHEYISKKSPKSLNVISKNYENFLRKSNVKILKLDDIHQIDDLEENKLENNFNNKVKILFILKEKQMTISNLIKKEKYEFSKECDINIFLQNFQSNTINSLLSQCSDFEKILKKVRKISEKKDNSKVEDISVVKIQEKEDNKSPCQNEVSNYNEEKSVGNFKERKKNQNDSSLLSKSSELVNTDLSSNKNQINSKSYFQDLPNEKILFDELERKVFKKENILTKNTEDNFSREYSILKMIEHKSKIIQNYFRRIKFKEKISFHTSKERIFKGWDKSERNLIQIFIHSYNDQEIESLFVKIYSLEKLNTYYENFVISDFFKEKNTITKTELKISLNMNLIITKILEILYLKINLSKN